jgi:hypothetical protein
LKVFTKASAIPLDAAADWREARDKADRVGEGDGLVGGEAAAVVGQPLHRLWRYEGADHLVVDADRRAAACGHPLPPFEQQARREAVLARHERDRHARLERLLDPAGSSPPPTTAGGAAPR